MSDREASPAAMSDCAASPGAMSDREASPAAHDSRQSRPVAMADTREHGDDNANAGNDGDGALHGDGSSGSPWSSEILLGRVPWLTLTAIAGLVGIFFLWQHAPRAVLALSPHAAHAAHAAGMLPVDTLLSQGAKSRALMVELGQWWRLLAANGLHFSGWHLAINALFLLNLGGPAEAIFRRIDYVLLLVVSALGTTLVSTFANPAVTCGTSGVVYGLWGAVAMFGLRYRARLTARYRRYFLGAVVPYAAFTLTLGSTTPGVDNWGHLGGLAAGAALALVLTPRIVARPRAGRDRAAWARGDNIKVALLVATVLLLAAGGLLRRGPPRLSLHRTQPKHGLLVPVPRGWAQTVGHADGRGETYAFDNGAGVVVAMQAQRADNEVSLATFEQQFLAEQLGPQLDPRHGTVARAEPAVHTRLAGLDAVHLRVEVTSPRIASRADYWLMQHEGTQYVVSINVPTWLGRAYDVAADNIITGVRLAPPMMPASAVPPAALPAVPGLHP